MSHTNDFIDLLVIEDINDVSCNVQKLVIFDILWSTCAAVPQKVWGNNTISFVSEIRYLRRPVVICRGKSSEEENSRLIDAGGLVKVGVDESPLNNGGMKRVSVQGRL